MPAYPTVHISAQISRGGFGSERTYRIHAVGGDFTGLAASAYCFDSKGRPIDTEPEKEVSGFIQARVITETEDGPVKVWLPDGEVRFVSRSDVNRDLKVRETV